MTLTIAAGGAQTLTAQQLEAGDSALTGQLGAGTGKWRLTVSSGRPLQVVNIVASTAGYWNNLSTTAAGGTAPAYHDAASERFDGQRIVYETDAGSFTLTPMPDDRFTETGESDGVTTTYMGDYGYTAIGPDAGRLALDYDEGDRCQANLYFSTRTGGWFASHCTGRDDPDGFWIGGSWSIEGDDDVDRFPTFGNATAPGDQSYTTGTAIDTLMLPEASGGNGTLTYSLSPSVPGLSFNNSTRQLSGTPSTANAYAMTYTVTDEDGDTDTLRFSIAVSTGTDTTGSLGVCQVGMMLSSGQSCTYPGTTDVFSVNVRGRGSFLGRLAGIRIRINNETINDREYDFEASHQGDGVWRMDRIAGSTEPPGAGTDTSPSIAAESRPGDQAYTVGTVIATLTLPEATGGNGTLTYSLSPDVPGLKFDATSRQLSGTPATAGTYAMTYMALDEDDDFDTLSFVIVVNEVHDVQVIEDFGDVRRVEVSPPGRVHVSVVDPSFDEGGHGQRITDIFLDNTSCASLGQLWGQREFLVNGVTVSHLNTSGIVRHVLRDDSGIFWTATDHSPLYATGRVNSAFFHVQDRPFHIGARAGAEWIRDHDTLVISSLENFTGEPTGNGHELKPLYCEDFDPERFIPRCGALDDYIAHTGVGMEKTIFVGAIDRFGTAQAAIRADGVFAPNTIYVESPDGSTSQATPVLAAYAANLAHANPTWSASELRTGLMKIASQEMLNHRAGSSAAGTQITERRTVNVIRPAMAPACPL